jgi:heptose-I-phosphate ethanolaminephosphotransferase
MNTINKFIQALKKDIKYFYFCFIIHAFPFIFIVLNNYLKNNISLTYNLKKTIEPLLYFELIFLLIYLIFYFLKVKYIYKILLSILVIILFFNSIDLFLYLNFSSQLTPELINIFFETNKNEATEFIITFFNKNILIVLFYYLLSIISFKFYDKLGFFKLILIGLLSIFIIINIFDIPGNRTLRKKHVLKNIHHSFSRYYKEAKDLKNFMENFEKYTAHITSENTEDEATYILIIGESFSKHHSSLYSYPRNTNPYMKSLKDKGELFVFNDVVSPHHFTRETLKKLVTTYSHDSKVKFEESMNIIDIMKKAGFKTYWISNQEDFAFRGAGLSSVIHRADVVNFTQELYLQDKDEKIYDEKLLPLFKNAINDKSSKKKFIVLHLFGSHYSYKYRYPNNQITFPIDSIENFFNKQQINHKEEVNHYDNSLVYNDSIIIKSIIEDNKLKNLNSFILYFSDHGQDVYDELNVTSSPPPINTLRGVEIPMIFWSSPLYNELHKENIANIHPSLDNPYSSEDVIYSLIDFANIKYSEHKPEKSIINKNFTPKERIVSSDGIIYKK